MAREPERCEENARGDPLRQQQLLDLRKRVDEVKRRHAMPFDSHLGEPDWEERASDGRFDLPDEEDE